MAYFPNGTAGQVLVDQCDNCLHGMDDGLLCLVAHVQVEFNYKQLDAGNADLQAAMNLLIADQGECRMKLAMEKAGIKIDLSEKAQLDLIETKCSCRMSDAWRCAKDQNSRELSCSCSCHRSHP